MPSQTRLGQIPAPLRPEADYPLVSRNTAAAPRCPNAPTRHKGSVGPAHTSASTTIAPAKPTDTSSRGLPHAALPPRRRNLIIGGLAVDQVEVGGTGIAVTPANPVDSVDYAALSVPIRCRECRFGSRPGSSFSHITRMWPAVFTAISLPAEPARARHHHLRLQ